MTNPIAKSVLYQAGFRHPGHTEYLAHLAADGGVEPRPVMMLWCDELAVVPVTIHEALRRVPELLTTQLIVETARIVAAELTARFGIATPRLAFSGLNPHAGENGAMGDEDMKIIAPAIAELRAEESMRAARIRPIRCSTPAHGPVTMRRWQCITIRR